MPLVNNYGFNTNSDTDSSDGDCPVTADQAEQLCSEFCEITGSDSAFAMMMLQQNGWDLQRAVTKWLPSASSGAAGVTARLVTSDLSVRSENPLKPQRSRASPDQRAAAEQLLRRSNAGMAAAATGGNNGGSSAHIVLSTKLSSQRKRPASDANRHSPSGTKAVERAVSVSSGSTRLPINVQCGAGQLKVISWNIDGLDNRSLISRASAVAETALAEQPDVVCLQEVVPENFRVLHRALCCKTLESNSQLIEEPPAKGVKTTAATAMVSESSNGLYQVVLGTNEITVDQLLAADSVAVLPSESSFYFTVMLLRHSTCDYLSHTIHNFSNSHMKRSLLTVKAMLKGEPFMLMTTHLESGGREATIRSSQLRQCFEAMKSADAESYCLLMGDFNVRDQEVEQVKRRLNDPNSRWWIDDVWEQTGSRAEAAFTWDTRRNDNHLASSFSSSSCWDEPSTTGGRRPFKPRFRFDRIYFRPRLSCQQSSLVGKQLHSLYIELIGLQRIRSSRIFPSDHWGVCAYFG